MRGRSTSATTWRAVALAAIIIAATPLASGAQNAYYGKNKVQYRDFRWQYLETPHFDIYFYDGYRDLAARTAVIVEYGYRKLASDFSHEIPWRIPVILYGSHADFQQTNVTWSLIEEGVQAFAEPTRKRMVIHYSGNLADFTHTTIHELVHIFTYDIVYANLLRSVISRSLLFQVPLWFMEGLSEYYSSGLDASGEMYMRDAAVFDYLPDLEYADGYMAYKAGQAALWYLNETYGSGKVIEIMDNLRTQRSLDLALQNAAGITIQDLSRDWKKAMRRRYWPLYADKKEPEAIARRLTDHMKQHHFMNTKPALSPDGERIVYFSDRGGLDGIFLMSALTGKVEKRLITGTFSARFEALRSMNSTLTWSPAGDRIAFVAKSDGRDRLFIMDVPKGKVTREIDLPLDFFLSPAWSPVAETIALVGTKAGRTDLYLFDLASGSLEQLTDSDDDESSPSWFPDGGRIAYSRTEAGVELAEFRNDSLGIDRLAGIEYGSPSSVRQTDSDIWSVDVVTGTTVPLIQTPGLDADPVVLPGGEEIVFASDESGITNLYRGSVATGSYFRFTDVLGGIFSPTYAPSRDRLVFSAFSSAWYDLFIMDEFSRKSKESFSTGGPSLAAIGAEEAAAAGAVEASGAQGEAAPGDTTTAPVAGDAIRGGSAKPGISVSGAVSGERLGDSEPPPILMRPDARREAFPSIVVDEDSDEDIDPDSLSAIRKRLERRIGTVQPYHAKFSPDYVGNGMGLFFSTGFGFGLMNQIAFSDLLGDNHLFLSFNIYRSIEDSDLIVSYYYLKRRIDYGVGVFQLKNYLSSRVTSLGEAFLDYRFFTERNYGLFGVVSFPFSTFTRLDLEFEGYVSEREFLRESALEGDGDSWAVYVPEKSTRRLFQPTLSLVHDGAGFGSFGPVVGSMWMASISRALSFSGSDISRTTAYLDYRRYQPVFYRNYLALRLLTAVSTGEDSRYFFLGGPVTMRGYDYLQFFGPRIALANLEYRYPLIDALVFGWPGQWGIRDIGGTLFLDAGSAWGKGSDVDPVPEIGPRVVNGVNVYSDFGLGLYMRFSFLILNFQFGWPTDFSDTGRPMFHFFLGPQF